MALSYGFFNAELTQSGQYDRVYAAEQFAEYFHLIVSNGVFPDPATQLQVVASNTPDMNVNVSDGYGWINGYFAKNEGLYPLAIQAASGTLNRVDAVVLRWVNASRSMELAIKTGTAASSPVTPSLQRDTDVYEIMLATVTVAAGATSISQSAITDKRADTSVCGWVTGAVQNIDTTNLFAQYDESFRVWFEDIQAQLSGDVATNLQNQINQLSSSKLGQSDMATDQEVADGINTTHWTNPKQVSMAAQTIQDVGTGKLIKTKLAISHFEGSTIEVPFSYNSDLEGYSFCGHGVYNGLIHIFGSYSSRDSSSSSWSYYAYCIIVDPELKQVVWKNTNLTNSSISGSYISFLRPAYNTYESVISSDGSVVAMRYNSGAYLMFDMKNRTCHYGIPINYLCGFFATDTFIGYFYADSTSNTRIHYKSRSSSGNSYSVRNLGIQLYNGYGHEYFAPIGVTGDSVLFYYRTSYTSYNLGKYTLSTDALQTGLGTVNSDSLYGYSALTTMDNKVFIYGTTPSGRGLFMVDPVASTVTPHIYPEAILNSNYSFLNERFTAFYFGTYGELMYFVFQMHSGLSVQFHGTVRVMAINRNTGELDSYYDIPFNEAVIRYGSSEQEHNMNFSWFEKKLDGKLGYNGYSMLDISQGVHQVIKSKMYLYYSDSSLRQNPMLGTGAWGILGECSQVDFLCVSGASVSNGNTLTISVVNKNPIYQMIPA